MDEKRYCIREFEDWNNTHVIGGLIGYTSSLNDARVLAQHYANRKLHGVAIIDLDNRLINRGFGRKGDRPATWYHVVTQDGARIKSLRAGAFAEWYVGPEAVASRQSDATSTD